MWGETQASRALPKGPLPLSHLINPRLTIWNFSLPLFLWCSGLKTVSWATPLLSFLFVIFFWEVLSTTFRNLFSTSTVSYRDQTLVVRLALQVPLPNEPSQSPLPSVLLSAGSWIQGLQTFPLQTFLKGPDIRYSMITGCRHWDTLNKSSKTVFETHVSYNLIVITSAVYTNK